MTVTFRIGLCAGVSVLVLGGCGGGGDGGGGGYPLPGAVTKLEDKLGTEFGMLYRADANSDAANPSANAAGAPDLTKDPLPVP